MPSFFNLMKLSSAEKGALVATANLLTIAACCAVMFGTGTPIEWKLVEGLPPNGIVLGLMVADLALLPTLLVGVGLGKLAVRLQGPPAARFLWLALASIWAVMAFGKIVGWIQLIPLAAIPTLVWTWHLERWTRATDAKLPTARTA